MSAECTCVHNLFHFGCTCNWRSRVETPKTYTKVMLSQEDLQKMYSQAPSIGPVYQRGDGRTYRIIGGKEFRLGMAGMKWYPLTADGDVDGSEPPIPNELVEKLLRA